MAHQDSSTGSQSRSTRNYNSFPVYDAVAATLAADRRAETYGDASTTTQKPPRALAPDLLRGLLMVIMAMDHVSVSMMTWQHGTGRESEGAGIPIEKWNFNTAYIVRTMTHLCAPGFTFLLGMGIVYLGKSRVKAGWGAGKLIRYFALRMAVLTLICVMFGGLFTGFKIWFMNAVLFALGVDYFVAGLLWLATTKTEPLLQAALQRVWGSDETESSDEESPLLRARKTTRWSPESVSWHIHNTLLLVISVVTIWWNIWMSPTGGHCVAASEPPMSAMAGPFPTIEGFTPTTSSALKALRDIWFWQVADIELGVFSGFPPMAWLSFAVLGLIYGRIMHGRPWSPVTTVGHVLTACAFFTVFVGTRLLHIGNLSEGCLHTKDQRHHLAGDNQYLASPKAFFYITKYPPDVAFWALTMTGNFLLLSMFGALRPSVAKRMTLLLDLGGAALFYYVVHMTLIMGLAVVLLPLFGHKSEFNNPLGVPGMAITNLYAYWAIWAFVIAVMWPVCRWYGRFKSTKGVDSLWRFF